VTGRRALRLLASLLLLGLAIVTVAPIEFRPVSPLSPQLERAPAMRALGLIFALAYTRRLVLVSALLFTSGSV
jgi:hypothetical protein